jgi:hypothetical protein
MVGMVDAFNFGDVHFGPSTDAKFIIPDALACLADNDFLFRVNLSDWHSQSIVDVCFL